jgi:hypothetical protein
MTVKPLLNTIELNFWNTVIPIMQNSSLVRAITPRIYDVVTKIQTEKPILIMLLSFFSVAAISIIYELVR